jgi:hypothetical protein
VLLHPEGGEALTLKEGGGGVISLCFRSGGGGGGGAGAKSLYHLGARDLGACQWLPGEDSHKELICVAASDHLAVQVALMPHQLRSAPFQIATAAAAAAAATDSQHSDSGP